MKYLISLLVLLFSLNAQALVGKANIGAVTVNPSNGSVLATSGSLLAGGLNASGNYVVDVMVSSTAAATFDFQALSSGTPVSHTYIMVPAGGSFNFTIPLSFAVPDGIVLSVVNVGAITGTVQANLYWAVETTN
jgi:hypothetical protein